MPVTIAFDVYGTLIDTQGVVSTLKDYIDSKAEVFSRTWRDKQLEYSFRRGLMRNYVDFSVCTEQALEYTCVLCNVSLTKAEKQQLLSTYQTLPPFEDVTASLTSLKAEGYRLYALSNGGAHTVEKLMSSGGLRQYFHGVVSVGDIKSFKPNPDVYHYFLTKSAASVDSAWLISSNPFDVIGAISAGMRAAWVRRTHDAVFDPWGIEPTITVTKLTELVDVLKSD
jgi:2-haloacid dehalogenase